MYLTWWHASRCEEMHPPLMPIFLSIPTQWQRNMWMRREWWLGESPKKLFGVAIRSLPYYLDVTRQPYFLWPECPIPMVYLHCSGTARMLHSNGVQQHIKTAYGIVFFPECKKGTFLLVYYIKDKTTKSHLQGISIMKEFLNILNIFSKSGTDF